MTDTARPVVKPALGVGNILTEAFSLTAQNLRPLAVLFIIAMVPILALLFGVFGSVAFLGDQADTFFAEMIESNPATFWTGYGAIMLIAMLTFSFFYAGAIKLLFSRRQGSTIGLGSAIGAGVAGSLRLFVMTFFVSLLFLAALSILGALVGGVAGGLSVVSEGFGIAVGVLLGIGLFVVMLWLIGVFMPFASIVVVEQKWFPAFGRSVSLSKEYRWPLVGVFILMLLALLIISLIGTLISAVFAFAGTVGVIVGLIVNLAVSLVGYGALVALITLAYARLLEIKEGRSISDLAEVFS